MAPLPTSSTDADDLLAAAIGRAAQLLTPDALLSIAIEVERADQPGPTTQATLADAIANPANREHAIRIARRWEREAPLAHGRDIARAIRAAAETARRFADDHELRLVVTGPDTPGVPVRTTRAVVRELIEEARERALLVTYTLGDDPEVFAAIRKAAGSGVRVDVLRETLWPDPNKPDHALSLADCVNLWHWPEPRGGYRRVHAKVTVVDERVALVTSANLTDAGMDRSIESGLLVRGGNVPRTLSRHFANLMSTGKLQAG